MNDRSGHIFKVTINGEDKTQLVNKNEVIVGRSKRADLSVANDLLSNNHFKFIFDGKRTWIMDLGSTNGTFLDGKKLVANTPYSYIYGQKIYTNKNLSISFTIMSAAGEMQRESRVEQKIAVNAPTPVRELSRDALRESSRGPRQEPRRELRVLKNTDEERRLPSPVQKDMDPTSNSRIDIRKPLQQLDEERNVRYKKDVEHLDFDRLKQKKEYLYEDVLALEEKFHVLKKQERDLAHKIKEQTEFYDELKSQAERLDHDNQDLENRLRHEEEMARKSWEDEIEGERHVIIDLHNEKAQILQDKNETETEYLKAKTIKAALDEKLEAAKKELKESEEKHFLLCRENNNFLQEERKLKESIASLEVEFYRVNEKSITLYKELQEKETLLNTEIKRNHAEAEEALRSAKLQAEHLLKTTQLEIDRQKSMAENELHKKISDLKIEANYLTHDLDFLKKEHQIAKSRFEDELHQQKLRTDEICGKREAEAEARVQKLSTDEKRIMADLEAKASDTIHQSHKEILDQVQSLEKKKADLEYQLNDLDAILKERSKDFEAKFAERKKETEAIAQNIIDEANAVALKISREEEHKLSELKKEKLKDIEQNIAEAKSLLKSTIEQTETQRKEQKQVLSDIEHQKKNFDNHVSAQNKDLEAFDKKIKKQCDDLVEVSNTKAKELISSAESKAKELVSSAENKAQEIVSEAETKRDTVLTSITIEKDALIQNYQEKFEVLKAKCNDELENIQKQEEIEFQSKRMTRAQNLALGMSAMIGNELKAYKAKAIDDEIIKIMQHALQGISIDLILEKQSEESKKLKMLVENATREKSDNQKFWFRLSTYGGIPVAILILCFFFPGLILGPRQAVNRVFEFDKEANDREMMKQMAKKAVVSRYHPPQTVEFKDSYVDNVLFTKDYAAKKFDKKFNDQFVIDVNEFMIYKLDLKDTSIIRFIGAEAKLIKTLQEIAREIDPEKPNIKINEMREAEKAFRRSLREYMDDDIKIQKMYDYSKKYWNDFYHPKVNSTVN